MRKLAKSAFAAHISIKLLVDDGNLDASQRARITPRSSERGIVQKIFTPDVGTNESEVSPVDAQACGKFLLKRTHRTLARGRWSFHVHDDRLRLSRKKTIPLLSDGATKQPI